MCVIYILLIHSGVYIEKLPKFVLKSRAQMITFLYSFFGVSIFFSLQPPKATHTHHFKYGNGPTQFNIQYYMTIYSTIYIKERKVLCENEQVAFGCIREHIFLLCEKSSCLPTSICM